MKKIPMSSWLKNLFGGSPRSPKKRKSIPASKTLSQTAETLELRTLLTVDITVSGILGSNGIDYAGVSGDQDGRLFRDGSPSVAGVAKAYPGTLEAGTNFKYDDYSFQNLSNSTTNATITYTGQAGLVGGGIFSVAYLGFNPADVSSNYLGDAGDSVRAGDVGPRSYGVELSAQQAFDAVFSDVDGAGGNVGQAYSFTVSLDITDVVITGTGAADSLVVTATGPDSGTFSLNGGPTFNFSGLTSFTFDAGGGGDTLTINNPAGGLFAPVNGITFTGGGGGDLENLGGGDAALNVGLYTPINATDGTLTHTLGATVQTINFTGLSPVLDTVAALTFTIDATAGADTINIVNGPGGTTQVNGNTFELVNFANKTDVIINALGGIDTITLNNTVAAAGLATLTVNAGDNADIVNLLRNAVGVAYTVNAGAGADTINLATGQAAGLNGLSGAITVDGGSEADSVTLDDNADFNDTYTVTSTTVTRIIFGGLTYSTIENLTLNAQNALGTNGNNTINVTSTNAAVNTTINAGGGDDNINVGNAGSLDGILGLLNVNGGALNDKLTINDAADASGNTYAIDGSSITRNGTQTINFATVEAIQLNAGDGADTITVTNLSLNAGGLLGSALTFVGNDGTDSLNLDNVDITNSGGDGLAVNGFDTVMIQNGSSFNTNGGDGIDLFNVDAVTISDTEASDNGGHGINIQNAGAVILTNVTANGNDPGVLVDTAASFTDTDGNYSSNDDGGIELIDIAGDVTLTRTTATDNDADDDNDGDGLLATFNNNAVAIGGSFTVNGGTFVDTTGFASNVTHQRRGIFVDGVAVNVVFDGSTDAITVTGNERDGVGIDGIGGTATFTDGTYSDNRRNGVDLDSVVGLTTLTDVTANGNNDRGVELSNLADLAIDGGDYTNNYDDGINVDGADEVTLTDVNATGNDANDDGAGDGANLTAIAGPIVVLGGTYNGNGTQEDGIHITNSPTARVYLGNDGATVSAVTASGNDDDGIDIDDVNIVNLDTVAASNNGAYGFRINDVNGPFSLVNVTDLTLAGNGTAGGLVSNSEELVYTTNKAGAGLPADIVDDSVTLTGTSITRTTPAQQVINYTNIDFLAVLTGLGNDTIDIQGTGANFNTIVFGGSGDDVMTISGDNLTADNEFVGDEFEDLVVQDTLGNFLTSFISTPVGAVGVEGNDQFTLNVTTNITATDLEIDGSGNGTDPGGASANRDRLTINDNNAAVSRAMSFDYQSQTAGDVDIDGFAITTEGFNLETVISNKAGLANDVEVHGNGAADEDITVAPLDGDSALVFIGTDLAGGGWNGPNADFFTTLPGIAGGSVGPDLLINSIDLSGVQVFNANGGNHQVYVDGPSEDNVVDGTAADAFGFGAGIIIPGFGAGNAFDDVTIVNTGATSTVSIFNNALGQLVDVVLPQASDFIQNAPPMGEVNRPGLIVNSGFEAGQRPGSFVADDITANISTLFYTKINGGNPGLTNDMATGAPQGDQLNLTSIGDMNVYSDGAVIPNVTIQDSVIANTGISFSSIERSVNTPGTGVVNIIGDNNDAAVEQNDVFVVRGEVIPTMVQATPTPAPNAFSLQIGGNKVVPDGLVDLSSRIYFTGVTRINANGGSTGEVVNTGVDTLDITPYADNTPLGWGIETYFNEGDPVLDGDLLIFNGVNGVSDNITIAPSGSQSGQVFSINGATNTPIAVVNYVLNSTIIINGNDGSLGDTDTLTLRGTSGVTPGTSGDNFVTVDYDALGTAASPFITMNDGNAGLLYQLQDVTNFDRITLDLQAGNDAVTISDTGAGAGGFQNTTLNIEAGDGLDFIDASGSTNGRSYVFNGGAGIDILIGGDGDDLIDGGDADDFISGGDGFNLIYGGAGSDVIFIEDTGDNGTDLIDGGDGLDALAITGTTGTDAFNVGPGFLPGSVAISTATKNVNAAGVESVNIDTDDGSDTVEIADLTGTVVTEVTIDTGDPADADEVTVNGLNSADNLEISAAGTDVTLAGLLYNLVLSVASPLSRLIVNGNSGDDTIKAQAGVETVVGITLNGGDGNDNLSADAIINGGAGDDTLQGGAGDDTINGNDGDDTIYFAAGGTDDIDGGAGFDRFIIESGNGLTTMIVSEAAVTVDGGTETFNTFAGMELVLVNATGGADNITVGLTAVPGVILGGYGADTIDGTNSTVPLIIAGGLGEDILTGGSAADLIEGEEGDDTITGGGGADTLNGGVGNDTINGGAGDDTIDGGDGFDTLNGGTNNDTVIGGGDGDNFLLATGDGIDYIEGGSGADWVTYTTSGGALSVDIATNGYAITQGADEAEIYGVEELDIDGNAAADAITIGDLNGSGLEYLDIELGTGADSVTLNGQSGADHIAVSTPGAGLVEIDGLTYEVLLEVTTAADTLTINGNEGDDTIKANAGVEGQIGIIFNGNDGDDFLSADAVLNGGNGNDTLEGGAGDDTINGNAGDDTILFSAGGTDTIDGGTGFDRILVNGSGAGNVISVSQTSITVDGNTETIAISNIDQFDVNGLGGNDSITVTLAAVAGVIDAGEGDDTVNGSGSGAALSIEGGAGNDTISGGTAADVIAGGDGNDTITGGAGADQISGGAGTDTFNWTLGDGADVITGGDDGADRLVFNGDAGANAIGLTAVGNHVNVTLGATVDTTGVEHIQVNALGGADAITIADLSATEISLLSVDLGAGSADTVTVNGRNTADHLAVSTSGAGAVGVQGLGYDLNITTTTTADTLTVNGNEGNDTITNNVGVSAQISVVFNGGDGNDTLLGSDGIDTLNGDAGNDVLDGGAGNDALNGGAGDDVFIVSDGTDTVDGNGGFNTLVYNGTAAGDTLGLNGGAAIAVTGLHTGTVNNSNIQLVEVNGLGGNDQINVALTTIAGLINAGDGNDTVVGTGSTTALTINGGDGNDGITGGDAADTINGDAGNDTIRGGLGADAIFGGDGADVFLWSIGDGSDVISGGGDGADRLDFTGDAAGNTITLAATPGHATVNLGADTVDTTGVENIQVNALGGDDTVNVGDLSTSNVSSVGVDLGAGGTDNLVVEGRTTADILAVTAPSATTLKIQGLAYDLNASNVALPDRLTVNGNQGDDEIKANVGVENTVNITFNGEEGNDFLSADAILNGGIGDDTLVGGVGADTLNGDEGDDRLTGNGGVDTFNGGDGYDTIVETRNANFTLTATTLVIGAEGTDNFTFIENAELTGGQSANLFAIGTFLGDTTVKGNGGSDTVSFAGGAQGIHIDLDAKDVDQIINLAGRKIVFADIIENLTATSHNDTINVDIAQFDRLINGGPEDSIPPGDRLNVDLLGSNATTTKIPNGKLGSFDGTVNGSGFTGTINYVDIETLVIKGANSTPPDFASAVQYDMGDGPRGVITADFDGDGILDMATANSFSNNISVRLGDGFGAFGPVVNYSAGGKHAKQTTTIAGGDVDGDGDIDLVVTNRKTNNVSVLLGNGDGTFGTATLYDTGVKKSGKFPTGVKLGDMNGDGNLDIVTANSNVGKNGSFSILTGDGAGGFGTANVTSTKGRRPRDLVLIDVDGDTNLDVVATNLFSKSVFVLSGNGAGGLGAPVSYDVAIMPNSIISGDFNGDGILDVVTTSLISPRLSILLGNGTGFDPVKEIKYPVTKLDISINAADINGDGNLDLLIANRNDNTLSYMLGNGNGSFNNRVDFKTGNTIFREPVSIAVGDFNNDGALDLIVANAGSDDVSVLIHVGIV